MQKLIVFFVLLLVCGCQTKPKYRTDPIRVDQVAFYQQLKEKRPKLLNRSCKDNMLLKPEFRKMLYPGTDSFAKMVELKYPAEMRAMDEAWAKTLRESLQKVKTDLDVQLVSEGISPTLLNSSEAWRRRHAWPFYVATYPVDKYVGLAIRAPSQQQPGSLRPKVYLQLDGSTEYLTLPILTGFAEALSADSFHGDLQINLAPGAQRFQMGSIVVHAGSMLDAKIAEATAIRYFGMYLQYTGRGFDISQPENKVKDWNTFLCEKNLESLPQYALDFLKYKD